MPRRFQNCDALPGGLLLSEHRDRDSLPGGKLLPSGLYGRDEMPGGEILSKLEDGCLGGMPVGSLLPEPGDDWCFCVPGGELLRWRFYGPKPLPFGALLHNSQSLN